MLRTASPGTLLLIATLVCLPPIASAIDTVPAPGSRVDAVWYADGSCRLKIADEETIGVTGIVADMGEDGARTMVHCDVESGQRITLLTRGDGLALGERVVLGDPANIDEDVNGSVAWISRPDPDVPADQLDKRFVIDGRIMIHSTPLVDTADSTLNADKLPFAEVHGWLEPLQRHPGGALGTSDPDVTGSAPETTPTRLACLFRRCASR